MNLITIENITKSYGDKDILNNVSLGINEGDKIGLIGINGTGKSTFLKIITGEEFADSGTITKGNKVRVEYLSQNPNFDFEATILEQVFKGNSKEMLLLKEYENILEKVTAGDNSLTNKLLSIQAEVDNMNLWQLESDAKTILTKLGLLDFNKKIKELSGGQRKRVALASALIAPCDLLILDEPTNHMDSDFISWLEVYLNNRKGALLMITHDRYFLDRVTNRIVEVHSGNLYSYEGNYSLYLEKKVEREELEMSMQNKRENLFRRELAWIRRGAKARTTKQKARIDRFEDLKDEMVDLSKEQLELSVVSTRLGNKIIEMENISKSFDKCVIDNFSYNLTREDRIGIVGPNGAGKSTLMKIINGELKIDSGNIEIGETVKVGFFSQESYHMDDTVKVIDYVKEIAEYLPLANGDRISASQMLERFLFAPEKQHTLIGKLSGGEKRRLYLLNILMSSPNVLLLDEPTNDLDITTLTILEEFIETFQGPVITVSHDRYFLDKVCNVIFYYEGNGKIKRVNGNYSDFINKGLVSSVDSDVVVKSESNKPKEIKQENKNNKKLKFSYKEQREFESIDDEIAEVENKIQEKEVELEKNATNFSKLQELLKEKEELEMLLEEKYERWTYLNELAEEIEKNKNS